MYKSVNWLIMYPRSGSELEALNCKLAKTYKINICRERIIIAII
jgi:hypothetical protein